MTTLARKTPLLKSRPRAIVFDLDGTLVDSLGFTFVCFNLAFQALGIRPHTPEEIMAHFGQGEDDIFKAMLGKEIGPKAYEIYKDFSAKRVGEVPLHPGIKELLKTIAERKIPTAVFTGRSRPTTEMILTHHCLTDLFQTIVTHNDVTKAKPHPEGLLKACASLNIPPEECVLLGDTWMDVHAAHDAGSWSVGVTWDGRANPEELKAASPHQIIHSTNEFWDKFWNPLHA